jgi:hypothetical protein
MKPLSPTELENLAAAIENGDPAAISYFAHARGMTDDHYHGWLKAVIWLGLTAFSWGLVIGVIYTAYLWLYL